MAKVLKYYLIKAFFLSCSIPGRSDHGQHIRGSWLQACTSDSKPHEKQIVIYHSLNCTVLANAVKKKVMLTKRYNNNTTEKKLTDNWQVTLPIKS